MFAVKWTYALLCIMYNKKHFYFLGQFINIFFMTCNCFTHFLFLLAIGKYKDNSWLCALTAYGFGNVCYDTTFHILNVIIQIQGVCVCVHSHAQCMLHFFTRKLV